MCGAAYVQEKVRPGTGREAGLGHERYAAKSTRDFHFMKRIGYLRIPFISGLCLVLSGTCRAVAYFSGRLANGVGGGSLEFACCQPLCRG